MSRTKQFLYDVSVSLGKGGEITPEVLTRAKAIFNSTEVKKCDHCGRFMNQHDPTCVDNLPREHIDDEQETND